MPVLADGQLGLKTGETRMSAGIMLSPEGARVRIRGCARHIGMKSSLESA